MSVVLACHSRNSTAIVSISYIYVGAGGACIALSMITATNAARRGVASLVARIAYWLPSTTVLHAIRDE